MQEIALHPNRNGRAAVTLPDPPPPPIFAEPAGPSQGLPLALAGLVNREFLATQTWKEQQKRAIREGAHPKVLAFVDAGIRRFKKVGIPMYAHCIIRTAEEQREMVRRGVSKDSPDDGEWPHQWAAVDIIHSVKGWNMNDEEWRLVGHLLREVSDQMGLSMEWGGDWGADWLASPPKRGWDPAHWQLKNRQAEPAKWWKAYPLWIRKNPEEE